PRPPRRRGHCRSHRRSEQRRLPPGRKPPPRPKSYPCCAPGLILFDTEGHRLDEILHRGEQMEQPLTETGLHSDITRQIIGAAQRVHRALGMGFLEKVYENALAVELRKGGLEVEQTVPIQVYYLGEVVGIY